MIRNRKVLPLNDRRIFSYVLLYVIALSVVTGSIPEPVHWYVTCYVWLGGPYRRVLTRRSMIFSTGLLELKIVTRPIFALFSFRSKKSWKLRVTGLCAGNSPGTGEFPAQMASYAENVSIWWRHHALCTHQEGFRSEVVTKESSHINVCIWTTRINLNGVWYNIWLTEYCAQGKWISN